MTKKKHFLDGILFFPVKMLRWTIRFSSVLSKKKEDNSSRLLKVTTGKKFWYGMENYSRG